MRVIWYNKQLLQALNYIHGSTSWPRPTAMGKEKEIFTNEM